MRSEGKGSTQPNRAPATKPGRDRNQGMPRDRTIVDDAKVLGEEWFRDEWLEEHGIDPQQSFICSVQGKGMEPTLVDGCSILVDRNRRRRRPGRVFMVQANDELLVRRIGKDQERRWLLLRDNPEWPSIPWSDGMEIIGEVRWLGRTF